MSAIGVLSDKYQQLSQWLLEFNDAVMFLKDIYIGKLLYQEEVAERWMDIVSLFISKVLRYEMSKEMPGIPAVPESAVASVQRFVEKDMSFQHSLKEIYKILATERFKRGLSEKDFKVLDRVVDILSENTQQAFRRIWRHT
jgi:hypothetical protein